MLSFEKLARLFADITDENCKTKILLLVCLFSASRLIYICQCLWSYCRGGKGDEQHYAEIADEDAERSRYFDEKAGLLGNSNQSSIVGGSRIGDSSKHGSASSGIARQDDTENKRMEKDAQWKTG